MHPFHSAELLLADSALFDQTALKVFHYQAKHSVIYSKFLHHLSINPDTIHQIHQIPFLPIEFFKKHRIYSSDGSPDVVFTSSGTTGVTTSSHYVAFASLYVDSFLKSFNLFYGPVHDYVIMALLPGYLERQGSSLVYMVQHLIEATQHPLSGFFLNNHQTLLSNIEKAKSQNRKILLIGVTHALVKLAEEYKPDLSGVVVMETGGMKGKGQELIREDLHKLLNSSFQTKEIHSEYGMTELLSQAYSTGNGNFRCPPWMRVITRDPDDPLTIRADQRTGGINVIDLANAYSCSFIATQDLGRVYEDGSFEVLGRFDNSDVRGCNLLVL